MEENHKKFLEHLENSTESVFIVARYLHKKGLDVKIKAVQKAKKHEEWKQYKDDGDIFVYKNGIPYRIEVKGLSCNFTSDKDWKFKDFIVCAKHSYDSADPIPFSYMILNKDKTHIAIVKTTSYPLWDVVVRIDSRYENVKQEFYTCPVKNIEWVKI